MKIKYFSAGMMLAALVMISRQTMAQDPHFSQYFVSPMTLNPALIGKGISGLRFSSAYRTQWWGGGSSPAFNTTAASLEAKISSSPQTGSGFAVGISMLSDGSNAGVLKNNYLSGGFSYKQVMDAAGKEILSGGITVTYANRFIDASKLYFQSQFGSMGFQRSIPSNDPASIANTHYWDLNAGMSYSKLLHNIGYTFGAAIFHAGSPKESTNTGDNYSLPSRICLQGGVQFNLGTDQFHAGAVGEIQSGNNIFTLGGVYKKRINDAPVEFINIGVWKRFGDAVYPYIAIEDENWQAGITYDIVTSSVKELYGSVTSLELSVSFKFGGKKTKLANAVIMFY